MKKSNGKVSKVERRKPGRPIKDNVIPENERKKLVNKKIKNTEKKLDGKREDARFDTTIRGIWQIPKILYDKKYSKSQRRIANTSKNKLSKNIKNDLIFKRLQQKWEFNENIFLPIFLNKDNEENKENEETKFFDKIKTFFDLVILIDSENNIQKVFNLKFSELLANNYFKDILNGIYIEEPMNKSVHQVFQLNSFRKSSQISIHKVRELNNKALKIIIFLSRKLFYGQR